MLDHKESMYLFSLLFLSSTLLGIFALRQDKELFKDLSYEIQSPPDQFRACLLKDTNTTTRGSSEVCFYTDKLFPNHESIVGMCQVFFY